MNKRVIRLLTGIAVLVLLVAAYSAYKARVQPGPADERARPITIGVIEPMTGVGAYWGESGKIGIDLAISDLKTEGYRVEAILEDSASKPTVAAAAANKLLHTDTVDALLTDLTGPSGAVSPIAQAANKPFYFGAFDPTLLKENPMSVKSFMNVAVECEKLARHAKSQGADRVAYVGIQSAITSVCMDEVRKHFDAENILIEVRTDIADTDYRSALTKAEEFRADYMFLFVYEPVFGPVLRQRYELGITTPFFCNRQDCHSSNVLTQVTADQYQNGIMFDFRIDDGFTERVRALGGNTVDLRGAASTYDGIQYLTRALGRCKGDASAQCVVSQILQEKDYRSVVGSNGFGKDRALDVQTEHFVLENGSMKQIQLGQ